MGNSMKQYHLAQINIARAHAPMDAEIMKSFVDRLDEVNALADTSPGFIWRLQTEEGDATAIKAFDDPLLLVNMSVWTSIDALKNFVYKTFHVDLIRDRDAWFTKMMNVHQTLWWVPAGHLPSVDEGKKKLDILQKNGPCKAAFTFAKSFEPGA